jgi:hypothetical protein
VMNGEAGGARGALLHRDGIVAVSTAARSGATAHNGLNAFTHGRIGN